jgi:SET domain-containing protein
MKKEKIMYKPLPESLTIKSSGIHDLGLFAAEDIAQATNLGMTHLKFGSQLIRTPLGGFINHSNDPNCFKTKLLYTNQDDSKLKFNYKKWNLVTAKEIKKGDELTLKYTFYGV